MHGPTGESLKVRGQFSGSLSKKSNECQQDIYVVENLHRPLLGRPALQVLRVVALVEPIQKTDVVSQFPDVFKGLGKLTDNCVIKLRENAIPYALTMPQRVPLPLLPKVKEELQRMERLGVITKIEEPTDWCAGMVVVPKQAERQGQDLCRLNKTECPARKKHFTIGGQILAQIGGAQYFSKLDANSGYWQIELGLKSAKLTTFITPFGRFCFNRLPFGITSAP